MIPRRRCGQHDLVLPALGMGCWAYGGGEYWGAQSQDDVDAVVRVAIEHGGNFFDTAEVYNDGGSERALGLALRGLPRDSFILGTKVSPSHTAAGTLEAHCEASLQRLGVETIDLYMVHWPITRKAIRHFTTDDIPIPSVEEAFAALMGLQRAGKIRHIGVSNFSQARIDEALATGATIVINELPCSLLTRGIEADILPHCRDRGIGVLGYMSLLQGVLTDKWVQVGDIPVWQRRTRHFDSRRTPQCRHGLPGVEAETVAAVQRIRAIAVELGLSTSALALKWAMAVDGITSSLCGSRNLRQFRDNLAAAEHPLDPAIIRILNQATAPLQEALGPGFDYYEHPDHDRTT